MTELDKLEQYLKMHAIPYERIEGPCPWKKLGERHQLIVKDDKGERLWDAVCQWGSYGYEDGLLEIYGSYLTGDNDVIGYLTAEDVTKMLESKQVWIFTFGCGQVHAGHYVWMTGSYNSAREKMVLLFGWKWSSQYSLEQWERQVKEGTSTETEMQLTIFQQAQLAMTDGEASFMEWLDKTIACCLNP